MRECVSLVWKGLDGRLRAELLRTVAHGGQRRPELQSLYWLASEMLSASFERVALEDACMEVIGAMPEQPKD